MSEENKPIEHCRNCGFYKEIGGLCWNKDVYVQKHYSCLEFVQKDLGWM